MCGSILANLCTISWAVLGKNGFIPCVDLLWCVQSISGPARTWLPCIQSMKCLSLTNFRTARLLIGWTSRREDRVWDKIVQWAPQYRLLVGGKQGDPWQSGDTLTLLYSAQFMAQMNWSKQASFSSSLFDQGPSNMWGEGISRLMWLIGRTKTVQVRVPVMAVSQSDSRLQT